MRSLDDDYKVNKDENFTDGGYFEKDKAMQIVTYSQDKALLSLSYRRFKDYVTV